MAIASTLVQVCLLVAALCGLSLSQAPGVADQSLFNLMNPGAATGASSGSMAGLGSLLNMGAGGGSFATNTGSPAPNPGFPTMGGGFPTMGGGVPMGASQQQQQSNPMTNMLPLMMFSGMDFSKVLMMSLFGGMGNMGGGGGLGMLPMLGLLNNM